MALIDNTISYYKFDENAANTTVEDSHASNTGTASTNTSNLYNASGLINSAFLLNGSNEYINLPYAQTFFDFTGGAISVWVKPTTTQQGFVLEHQHAGGNDRIYLFYTGGNIFYQCGLASGAGSFSMSTGSWHNLVMSWDGSNVKFYLDGVLKQTKAYVSVAVGSNVFNVGRASSSSNRYFDGEVDEFGIFDASLTDGGVSDGQTAEGQVAELYNSGAGLAYPFSAAGTLRQIKIGGSFADKPILTKVGGSFVDKPIKIKVGGTFQDA